MSHEPRYLVVYKARKDRYMKSYHFNLMEYAYDLYKAVAGQEWATCATLYKIMEDDAVIMRQYGKVD